MAGYSLMRAVEFEELIFEGEAEKTLEWDKEMEVVPSDQQNPLQRRGVRLNPMHTPSAKCG